MVVVTHISTSFHQISPSLFHLRLHIPTSSRPKPHVYGFALSIRAYIEKPNSISSFANKVISSLPVIGLLTRILSNEGGVCRDLIGFAEFRKRVGNKCPPSEDYRDFYEFQQQMGKVIQKIEHRFRNLKSHKYPSLEFHNIICGTNNRDITVNAYGHSRFPHFLKVGLLSCFGRQENPCMCFLCCWVAAVGVGFLKYEEILKGVTRVSISNVLEFEKQNLIALMSEARQRGANLNIDVPTILVELRVEKAVEGIYACCFRRGVIKEEDEMLLQVMLTAVFPSVDKSEINIIINEKAKRVAQGGEEENLME